MTEVKRKILKYHLKVMLPQAEGIILLDSGQGDGDGTLLSLKRSLDESDRTEQR